MNVCRVREIDFIHEIPQHLCMFIDLPLFDL